MRESIDFGKIEQDAQKVFEMRQSISSPTEKREKEFTAEESEKYIENIRLAYKDLEDEVTKQIKSDPQKAEQIERLGMGVGRNYSSSSSSSRSKSKDLNPHSAMTDMFTIEQADPASASQTEAAPFSSSSSKLDLIDRNYDRMMRDFPTRSSAGSSSVKPASKKSPVDSYDEFWDALESVSSQQPSFSNSSKSQKSVIDSVPENESSRNKSRSQLAPALSSSSSTDEAQKKFGSAKAISSSQFFGEEKQMDYEDKARLNRFAGASSLSSDQFFGREEKGSRGGGGGSSSFSSSAAGNLISGANLYDMKEGVKEGVTRVAGRLSNLASDLMSSVQEKYGGY